jgi:hypothetical protein
MLDMIGEAGACLSVEIESGIQTEIAQLLNFVVKLAGRCDDTFEAMALECLRCMHIGPMLGHREHDEIDVIISHKPAPKNRSQWHRLAERYDPLADAAPPRRDRDQSR